MKKCRKGFTLLELMIALGLIVFVIAGLFSSFIYAILLNETTGNLVKAANDAQYVLEEMKGLAYGSLAAYAPPALNSLPSESIAVVRNTGLRVTEVTVNVAWNERNRNRSFALTTRIAR
jgi:prepilin-type N-terminal cleavage/methylation domain-containing protein